MHATDYFPLETNACYRLSFSFTFQWHFQIIGSGCLRSRFLTLVQLLVACQLTHGFRVVRFMRGLCKGKYIFFFKKIELEHRNTATTVKQVGLLVYVILRIYHLNLLLDTSRESSFSFRI